MEFELKTKTGLSLKIDIADNVEIRECSGFAEFEYNIILNNLYLENQLIEKYKNRTYFKYKFFREDEYNCYSLFCEYDLAKNIQKVIGNKKNLENLKLLLNKEDITNFLDRLTEEGKKGVAEAKENKKKMLLENNNKIADLEKVKFSYSGYYGLGFGSTDFNCQKFNYLKNVHEKVKLNLIINKYDEYCYDVDHGDYVTTSYYSMPSDIFLKLSNEIDLEVENKNRLEKEKDIARQKKKEELFKLAKETGKPQELYRYSVPCDDRNEECNIDIIIDYAMPDGSVKTEKHHTW